MLNNDNYYSGVFQLVVSLVHAGQGKAGQGKGGQGEAGQGRTTLQINAVMETGIKSWDGRLSHGRHTGPITCLMTERHREAAVKQMTVA